MTKKQLLKKAAPRIMREILRSIPFLGVLFKVIYVILDILDEPPQRKKKLL